MTARSGFYHAEQEKAFMAGRERAQRGGPDAPTCGARTRQGRSCQNPPIREGKGRCLQHAGPHAARAYRERQRAGLKTGRVSAEEWNRAEARRAANKLSSDWRKNPWLPGATIDLGPHEGALRRDLSARGGGFDMLTLAPAVADWLRWKFRRYQIDLADAKRWDRIVTEDLPRRVEAAEPPPAGHEGLAQVDAETPAGGAVWGTEGGAKGGVDDVRSKRSRPDLSRVPPKVRGEGYSRPGRPRKQEADADEIADLMEVYRECRSVVGPMLAGCHTSEARVAVLRALRDFIRNPQDMAAQARWMEAANRFRPH